MKNEKTGSFLKPPAFIRILLIKIETSLESVNTSAGIYKLLLAGVERMALGANFHLDILLCRLCFDYIAAVAGNSCFVQCRMDVLFHSEFTSFINVSFVAAHQFP
jgi:hypothetical protein